MQTRIVDGIDLGVGEEGHLGFHRTDQQRNVRRLRRCGRIERIDRQRVSVDDRREVQWRTVARSRGGHELLDRHLLQLIHLVGLEIQLGEVRFCRLHGGFAGDTLDRGTAFDHGAMEQALRRRHCHQRADFSAAAGLAEERDVARIAAEGCDVVAHPFERCDDVEVAQVAGVGVALAAHAREVQVPDGAEPVIDGDDDNVVMSSQPRAVITHESTRAAGVAAAVQPDHDGAFTRSADTGCPDIQAQAVLAHGLHAVHGLEFGRDLTLEGVDQLRRTRSELEGLAHAAPWLGFGRGLKPPITGSARSVRQSLEGVDLVLQGTADLS